MVPALPVVHGTTLTLNCQVGYTNLGGNKATCQNGQVVPTDQAPDCSGKTNINEKRGCSYLKPFVVIIIDDCFHKFKFI